MHALAVHRLGTALHGSSRPAARLARPLYRMARALVVSVYHVELPATARIGRRLFMPHPHGIVVVPGATLGDDCMIRHNVTVGAGSDTRGGTPTIGDRVQFGPGSIVMGDVHVGDDVLIGPGAVVIHDVPAGSRVLAPAATARPAKSRRAA
ncbi:serine O-acetyltransferase [Quadrisphaera sp. DSM 44207]|uniref:serine O-acetyltransferase n=1 Tax=Quadrisphaera sp. DSM 44207 TaxID=1881057 RepID=UPI0015A128D2|nr:serine acetyltransferase [Quadrisphaera sp. DSM 44207]